jgi:UDP-N-acetylmuramate--alanine ligase
LYPEHKSFAVFQPHLFSRTSDFADDFAKSLSNFDEVLLMDIYPTRELLWRYNVRMVVVKMKTRIKLVVKENVIESILASDAR